MLRRILQSRVAILGVCLPLAAAGCSSEKSRNPLSPDVAGPIAGVSITSPKPLEPANGKEITAGTQIDLVIENASTNGERPLWQQIEVATDQAFSAKVHSADRVALGQNGRTTYRLPSALTGGRAYFWRVRALDGANTGPFSDGAMFKVVVPVVIEPPIPVSPVGDAVTPSRAPQLVARNTAVSGPAGTVIYSFQISTDPAFGAGVTVTFEVPRSGGETTTFQLPELPADTKFFWRAIGSDGTHVSPWSPTQGFKTPAPPPPVTPPPPPPPTNPPPTNPPPTNPPPSNPPPSNPPPGQTRNIDIGEALQIIQAVHDQLGYDLGSRSVREQRVEFFWTAVAVVHFGHARFNPRGGDPGWCVKDAGGGRPPSDDVIVRCSSRDAWDLIGNSGGDGYRFHQDYIGRLPGGQNVYPPPRSSLPR